MLIILVLVFIVLFMGLASILVVSMGRGGSTQTIPPANKGGGGGGGNGGGGGGGGGNDDDDDPATTLPTLDVPDTEKGPLWRKLDPEYQRDVWDRPEFALPVGLIAGYLISPEVLLWAYKKAKTVLLGLRVNYAITPTATDALIKGSAKAGQEIAERGTVAVVDTALDGARKAALATRGVSAGAKFMKGTLGFLLGTNPVSILYNVSQIGLMILDIIDPKGYNKMTFNKNIEKMKQIPLRAFKHELARTGAIEPVVVGPLDKLSAEKMKEYAKKLSGDITDNPHDPVILELTSIFNRKFNDGQFDTQLEFDDFVMRYMYLQPMDNLADEEFAKMCLHTGGKIVKFGPDYQLQCSYKTEQECDASYSWPDMKPEDQYVEWDKDYNVCKLAFGAEIRKACETDEFSKRYKYNDGPRDRGLIPGGGLTYNKENQNCNITRYYCEDLGKINFDNRNPKVPDCTIPTWQRAFELLFSTYLIRSLR